MNIYDHCRLSVRKFGGHTSDYYEIHKFIDSSKLFHYHPSHRLLLHNLFGVEMTIKKFGDLVVNNEHKTILVRDIAAEHCKEDLSSKVPSLQEWLIDNDEAIASKIVLPEFKNKALEKFVLYPKFKSNCHSALLVTFSNFGVYLAKELLGVAEAKELQSLLPKDATVANYLHNFKFTEIWQYTVSRRELEWLKADALNNTKK